MAKFRHASHTVFSLRVHLVWITKYRFKVSTPEIGAYTRDVIREDCSRLDIQIISGVVSGDHIHLYISYPPKLSVSGIMKQLKGRSSKKAQQYFPQLKKRYWGQHFWGIGYGAFSSGNVTDEMIKEYIEKHDKHPNHGSDAFEVSP